ncbi:MAG: ribosome maturation factor RimP [Syntrophus sp. (in: bacteria)]|jgi:ribosome maturation factor RimP|nr:ribosome maturation factor RimP [Syntrophus sp. (in: bacteria)]
MASEYVKKLREDIWHLVEPVLESEGFELIQVECLRMKTRWIVRIYMDREGGVTLDDCSGISSQLGDFLDVHDLPPGPYTLEVSSPGLDRPLVRDKDFVRYQGCDVSVRLEQKVEGIRHFRGRLIEFREEEGRKMLVIEMGSKLYQIPRDLVVKANLIYRFD